MNIKIMMAALMFLCLIGSSCAAENEGGGFYKPSFVVGSSAEEVLFLSSARNGDKISNDKNAEKIKSGEMTAKVYSVFFGEGYEIILHDSVGGEYGELLSTSMRLLDGSGSFPYTLEDADGRSMYCYELNVTYRPIGGKWKTTSLINSRYISGCQVACAKNGVYIHVSHIGYPLKSINKGYDASQDEKAKKMNKSFELVMDKNHNICLIPVGADGVIFGKPVGNRVGSDR